jgi:hypothetical protein
LTAPSDGASPTGAEENSSAEPFSPSPTTSSAPGPATSSASSPTTSSASGPANQPFDGASSGLQSGVKNNLIFIILRGKIDSRQSIMADEILGQQKIVIKEFELETFRRLPYFNGLTLLGDGRVVLILDSEKLLES